jgi:hypothetical protein
VQGSGAACVQSMRGRASRLAGRFYRRITHGAGVDCVIRGEAELEGRFDIAVRLVEK